MQDLKTPNLTDKKAGKVIININTAASEEKISSRGIYLQEVRNFNITIKAQGLTTINDTLKLQDNNRKIYSLNIVRNLIIIAEPLNAGGNPICGGAKLYGYGEIAENSVTTINVSWRLTPVGRVLDNLYTAGYSLSAYDPTSLQTAVDNAATNADFNLLAVDTDKIASQIRTNVSYSTIDMLSTATITGTVNGFSTEVLAGAKAMLNEPFAQPVVIINNKFTFPNIAPGSWRVTLSDGLKGTADVTIN